MSLDYPGHPAAYPFYRTILREMITSSARNCDIKVVGCDRIRYSVYEGNKMYLLNTDYDMPINVKVIFNGEEKAITLEPLELRNIML